MTADRKIIVVAGARGNLGKLVCDALLARARADGQPLLVRGLVRKSAAHTPTTDAATDTAPQQLVIEPVRYDSDADLDRVCTGAYAVVSALQGHTDVIVEVQARLFAAAIKSGTRRFIPSDFSLDFTQLPAGANRNFDTRLEFHRRANELIAQSKSSIEVTSIFQGAFTELLGSGWLLLDYKKRQVTYFGSPDTTMDFTTTPNTAEFTAAVALDPKPTPKKLLITGTRLTPAQAQQLAKRVTGADFKLKRMMSVGMLKFVIRVMKFFKPGKKDDVFPMWVGMQYAYCMALGIASPAKLDNDRYTGITWMPPDEVVRAAYLK